MSTVDMVIEVQIGELCYLRVQYNIWYPMGQICLWPRNSLGVGGGGVCGTVEEKRVTDD